MSSTGPRLGCLGDLWPGSLKTKPTPYTDAVLEGLAEVEALVPAIWALEVGNALVVAERRRTAQSGRNGAVPGPSLATAHHGGAGRGRSRYLGEIMALAREQQLSTYDAAYLHLAMRHGLPLATAD